MTNNHPKWEPEKPEYINLGQYILKYRKPVLCNNLLKWGRFMEKGNRKVRRTFINDQLVCTDFLGLDHDFFYKGKPVLFETMIFNGEWNDYQTRCTTWREALAMHKAAIKYIKEL